MAKAVDKAQILYRAVTDSDFGKYTIKQIPATEEYFEDYNLEVEAINQLYRLYEDPISKEALLTYTKRSLSNRNKLTDKTAEEAENKIANIYSLADKHASNYSNDKAINSAIDKWSRQNILVGHLKPLLARADFSEEKDLQELQNIVTKSLEVGSSVDKMETVDLFEDDADKLTDILAKTREDTIPSGWDELDKYMGGGLARGEMAMVVAKSGYGKTQTLVNLAKQYVLDNKNVVYFALEEKSSRMLMRLVRLLTGTATNEWTDALGNLNKDLSKEFFKHMHQLHQENKIGDLVLEKSRPQTVSIADIERTIHNYGITRGHYPDVIMVDYPDLMVNTNLGKEYSDYKADGILFEQLRAIGEKYNMLVWVASQTNRTANQQDIVDAYAIEGSKQKLNPVELCISLNRTPLENDNGYIRFYMDKVRNGENMPSNRMIYMKVNTTSIAYENETTQDRANHEEILKKSEDDHFGEYRKESNQRINVAKAREKINKANLRL